MERMAVFQGKQNITVLPKYRFSDEKMIGMALVLFVSI